MSVQKEVEEHRGSEFFFRYSTPMDFPESSLKPCIGALPLTLTCTNQSTVVVKGSKVRPREGQEGMQLVEVIAKPGAS